MTEFVAHTSSSAPAGFGERTAWLGSSEMATVVRAFDWAKTPLGPLEAWPQSLKSAAAICLRSPFQMAIYWGAELNCIYNDAERKVLGRMHPGALGLPARELLRDSWPIVGPQLRGVIEHGKGIFLEDQPLSFDRSGRLEVSYFTYSYSPILDDDDEVAGVLLVTEDTTKRVLASRRSEAVREMTARSLDAPTPARACLLSADALTSGEDVPFALIYLVDEVGSLARCVAARARPGSIEATRSAVGSTRPQTKSRRCSGRSPRGRSAECSPRRGCSSPPARDGGRPSGRSWPESRAASGIRWMVI